MPTNGVIVQLVGVHPDPCRRAGGNRRIRPCGRYDGRGSQLKLATCAALTLDAYRVSGHLADVYCTLFCSVVWVMPHDGTTCADCARVPDSRT